MSDDRPNRLPLVWTGATLAVAALMTVATYMGMTTRVPFPPEAYIRQEAIYRTFFFHVPTAINAKFMLYWVFGVSVLWLLSKSPLPGQDKRGFRNWLHAKRDLLDRINLACVEVALAGYTFVLISGMMWADSAWGKAWSWEPRLTAVAIVWFLIVGMLLLRGAVDDPERRHRFAAVFGILLFVGSIFIAKATTWFAEQLHPGADTANSAAGYKAVNGTFVFCIAAIFCLFTLLALFRVRAEGLRRRVAALTT